MNNGQSLTAANQNSSGSSTSNNTNSQQTNGEWRILGLNQNGVTG